MDFHEALTIATAGFNSWAAKPHNKRWFARIDGTPIPNDLRVCVAEAFVAALVAEEQAVVASSREEHPIPSGVTEEEIARVNKAVRSGLSYFGAAYPDHVERITAEVVQALQPEGR